MGCEGSYVVTPIRRVSFCVLPESDWKDQEGQPVIGPVYELRVADVESSAAVTIRGNANVFTDIIVGLQAVMSGHDSNDEWTIYIRNKRVT